MLNFLRKKEKKISEFERAVMVIEYRIGRKLSKEENADFCADYLAALEKEILNETKK